MAKRTNTQPAASVIAFAGTLSVARASQLAAIESWADVYESAALMLAEVPSRDLAKQLEAAGATCNKDTAGFYADAAIWAPLMRTDGEADSLFMRAAVKADQSATLLPHECVSYGRNRAGLTIEEVREIMRDATLPDPSAQEKTGGTETNGDDYASVYTIGQLSKAIRTLRTPAKKSRNQNQNQGDQDQDQDQDQGDQDQEITPEQKAINYAQGIIGPMAAMTRDLLSGAIPLPPEVEMTLNAHWHELVKAARAVKEARKTA